MWDTWSSNLNNLRTPLILQIELYNLNLLFSHESDKDSWSNMCDTRSSNLDDLRNLVIFQIELYNRIYSSVAGIDWISPWETNCGTMYVTPNKDHEPRVDSYTSWGSWHFGVEACNTRGTWTSLLSFSLNDPRNPVPGVSAIHRRELAGRNHGRLDGYIPQWRPFDRQPTAQSVFGRAFAESRRSSIPSDSSSK